MQQHKEHPKITALKQQEISQVLCDAFAHLYDAKPQFPVTYLAQYLLSHCRQKKAEKMLSQSMNTKKKIIDDSKKQVEKAARELQARAAEEKKVKQRDEQFRNTIATHPNHIDLLENLCNFLEKRFNLTGVYIAELKQPKRVFQELADDSENAHLEVEQPKRIEYFVSSDSHKSIIKDRWLPVQGSVTGTLFQEKAAEQQGGDASANAAAATTKKNYVYIGDVVKNEKMNYFKFPRLGCYMAVPLIYKSSLAENIFEGALEETLKYNKAVEEQDKQNEKKEAEFREQYEEKSKSGAQEKELEEMERKFEEQKQAAPQVPQPVLPNLVKSFAVCLDTLGQARELSEKEQEEIVEFVEIFKTCWENTELAYLKNDVECQIKYIQSFEVPLPDHIQKSLEEQEKQLAPDMEELNKFKANQKQYNYELDCLRLEKLKEQLSDQKYQVYMDQLFEQHILRYPAIMQCVLYFLGQTKKDVNLPGTNILDWRKVKTQILKSPVEDLVNKLTDYSHRGLKNSEPLPYAKWNRLVSVLDKFEVNTVMVYNLFYGKLLKYMQMTARLRRLDCELRLEKQALLKKQRQEKKAENDKIIQERERIREEQRNLAKEKEDHVFDEEAWETQYMEEHPLAELGEEVVEDVDLDFQEPITAAPPAAS